MVKRENMKSVLFSSPHPLIIKIICWVFIINIPASYQTHLQCQDMHTRSIVCLLGSKYACWVQSMPAGSKLQSIPAGSKLCLPCQRYALWVPSMPVWFQACLLGPRHACLLGPRHACLLGPRHACLLGSRHGSLHLKIWVHIVPEIFYSFRLVPT